MKRMEYPSNFQIYRAAIRTPIKTIPTKPLKMQKRLLDFISGAWNRIMKSFRSLLCSVLNQFRMGTHLPSRKLFHLLPVQLPDL